MNLFQTSPGRWLVSDEDGRKVAHIRHWQDKFQWKEAVGSAAWKGKGLLSLQAAYEAVETDTYRAGPNMPTGHYDQKTYRAMLTPETRAALKERGIQTVCSLAEQGNKQ